MDLRLRAVVPPLVAGYLTVAALSSVVHAQQPVPQPPRSSDLDALAAVTAATPAPRRAASAPSPLDRALAAGDWAQAEQLLADEIARQPKSTVLLTTIAGVFLRDRRPLNAAIALKKADALAPLSAEHRLQLVLAYVAMGQRDWARPELARLIADRPDGAIYHYWLGRLDYDDGLYQSAVTHLGRAAAIEPRFARAFDNLGLCYEALDQIDEAMTAYRAAIRLNGAIDPRSPWPLLNLGVLLIKRGELDEAEALLRQALEIEPAFARAHYHLGLLLERTARLDAAVVELRRAADADPAFAEPLYALARIYRQQAKPEAADAALATFRQRQGGARR